MSNGYKSDTDKSPRELEREVDEQRANLEGTISELMQRFVPSQWMEQVVDYVSRGGGGDLSRNIMATVRANPVPSMLAATGLAWLMFSPNRQPRYLDDESPSRASYGVDPAYDPHSGEGHHELGEHEHGSDRLRHMSDSARHRMSQTRHQASAGIDRLLQEQPLAVGVLGIALGAILGASMPGNRREDELLYGHKQYLRDKASDLAVQASNKMEEVGNQMADQIDPNKTH